MTPDVTRRIERAASAADAADRARAVLEASERIDYADPLAVQVAIGKLQGAIDNLLDALDS
ncbi:hypothetical protein ABZ508_26650 [Streptomyces lavendulocolor]|uniref:Uncharacterized protein n=1 Tax=Streptomyces lavendulocolor TaxID=67316 RepID=A0ABV2WC46_9ACTN